MKRKRYRFIFNGVVLGSDEIRGYRLVAANNPTTPYNGKTALKVHIPDDLELTKYSCDPYSTTEDTRTLDELGYDFVVWYAEEKKWKVHNEFKGTRPCDIGYHQLQILTGAYKYYKNEFMTGDDSSEAASD